MKLIWLSVAPYAPTGYGMVTRALVPRIQEMGHEVVVATKHFHCGDVEWNGIHVIQGMDVNILNRMVDRGEYDYIFTLLDNHALPGIPHKWISYTPFDTEKIPKSISDTLPHAELIIALTKHGQSEIQRIGYDCLYAPHGVDTATYCPNEAKRLEGRKLLGWEDKFIIGSVGVNYEDDRKNFVNLVRAFKTFHDRHNEARLYLSSNSTSTNGSDYLPKAIESLGLNKVVLWTDGDKYFTGHVPDEMMANRYRMMDVFCFPTRGEGFGLPLLEAEATGVPVVTTGASTGPELCPSQYLIPVKDYEWEWFNKEWRPNVSSESILAELERVYADPNRSKVGQLGVDFAKTYDWDVVFDTYWKPVLKEIEGLKTRVKRIPDYRKLYEAFTGRIAMSDCNEWCHKNELCDNRFSLLPGEQKTERPIMARSYPVVPDSDGRLMVHTDCPMHNWISKKFKKDVAETWEYLWGFPAVRDYFGNRTWEGLIPFDKLVVNFNAEYKWAMQSRYKTNCPDLMPYMDGTALEVGAGDGARVIALREQGVNAIGIEINPAQENTFVQKGNAENLPFEDASVSTVYSVDVLEHLDHPQKALSEMFRVSKGLVVNSITPSEDPCFVQDPTHKVNWDRERWKREIDQFGEITDVLEPFTVVAKKREER